MKNEILEFFQQNEKDLEFLIEDSKSILTKDKINDQRSFTLLNLIYEIIKDEKTDLLLTEIAKINETTFSLIKLLLKEEQCNIIDYFSLLKFQREEEYPKLVDFEWKFVGLATLDKFEVGDLTPKILLKLIFNNGSEKIIETDFSALKKLHEEIEENLLSFNSTYAKRIETFAK